MPRGLHIGVVLYRNEPQQISLLVRSLRSASVSFLDNSPTDELRGALPALDYRHAGANLGFGAGHNRLMRGAFARPEVDAYLCLNPDAVLHPDCIDELWKEGERHASWGLIEARQFPDEHAKPYDPVTHATPWASGCCLFVSRALYERIGGFDERFFLYAEDVDLSWRARAAGLHVGIAPGALVHHYVGDRAPDHDSLARIERARQQLAAKVRATPELRPVADLEHGGAYAVNRW